MAKYAHDSTTLSTAGTVSHTSVALLDDSCLAVAAIRIWLGWVRLRPPWVRIGSLLLIGLFARFLSQVGEIEGKLIRRTCCLLLVA
jgi:hypothetical protein